MELNDGRSASRDNDITDPILVVRPSILVLPSMINGLRFNPTLAIGGGGALSKFETTKLLTVEETLDALDRAQAIGYRPPGA